MTKREMIETGIEPMPAKATGRHAVTIIALLAGAIIVAIVEAVPPDLFQISWTVS